MIRDIVGNKKMIGDIVENEETMKDD